MRTPEQVAADEGVRRAVENQCAVYGWNERGVLTDFIILGALQTFDEDGVPEAAVFSTHAEESMPFYRMLGLTEAASARFKRQLSMSDEEEP